MKLLDVNGNVTSEKPCYCRGLARRIATDYETDSMGRIMVNLQTGGFVVFFERDEKRFTKWVRNNLKRKAV